PHAARDFGDLPDDLPPGQPPTPPRSAPAPVPVPVPSAKPRSASLQKVTLALCVVLLVALLGVSGAWLYVEHSRARDTLPPEKQAEKAREDRIGAFLSAAEKGQLSRVTELLKEGIHPNDKDEKGETALMKAAARGHVEVVTVLLVSGAQPNERDAQG